MLVNVREAPGGVRIASSSGYYRPRADRARFRPSRRRRTARRRPATPREAAAPPRGPAARRPAGPLVARGVRSWAPVLVGCVVLAAVSLLLPGRPTYDPWAWIIWGREIAHGTLSTAGGPAGSRCPSSSRRRSPRRRAAAPDLWLSSPARAASRAIVMGFRLGRAARRPAAGFVAAARAVRLGGLRLPRWRGNSEGLLVGLSLARSSATSTGGRALGLRARLGAALLRPEVWPFWGLYGLWLLVREPRLRVLGRRGLRRRPVAWFCPE